MSFASEREYIVIGPAPSMEDCVQVGAADFHPRARLECQAFARQIERAYPPPEGTTAEVKVKAFRHDFGTYYEVVVTFHPEDQKGLEYALLVEKDPKGLLTGWDQQAKAELRAE